MSIDTHFVILKSTATIVSFSWRRCDCFRSMSSSMVWTFGASIIRRGITRYCFREGGLWWFLGWQQKRPVFGIIVRWGIGYRSCFTCDCRWLAVVIVDQYSFGARRRSFSLSLRIGQTNSCVMAASNTVSRSRIFFHGCYVGYFLCSAAWMVVSKDWSVFVARCQVPMIHKLLRNDWTEVRLEQSCEVQPQAWKSALRDACRSSPVKKLVVNEPKDSEATADAGRWSKENSWGDKFFEVRSTVGRLNPLVWTWNTVLLIVTQTLHFC